MSASALASDSIDPPAAPAGEIDVLVGDLNKLALCRTSHPADAATALIQAAARILSAQLPPQVIAAAITEAMEEALAMLPPLEVGGHA